MSSPFYLLGRFAQIFERYLMQQRPRFDQTDAFGHRAAPLFTADRLRGR
jgi:hypothetical protein